MKRVVLDTNVYISAILFGGKPEEIWKGAKSGKIQAFVSEAILEELSSVLRRKFCWKPIKVKELLQEIEEFAFLVIPQKRLSAITEHDADNRILECALEAKAGFLVSGDKHLLSLKKFRGTKILNPSNFLEKE